MQFHMCCFCCFFLKMLIFFLLSLVWTKNFFKKYGLKIHLFNEQSVQNLNSNLYIYIYIYYSVLFQLIDFNSRRQDIETEFICGNVYKFLTKNIRD